MGHLRPLGWNLGSIHKYWTSLKKLIGSNTLAYLDPPLLTKKAVDCEKFYAEHELWCNKLVCLIV